jgi:hypothetical protein
VEIGLIAKGDTHEMPRLLHEDVCEIPRAIAHCADGSHVLGRPGDIRRSEEFFLEGCLKEFQLRGKDESIYQ